MSQAVEASHPPPRTSICTSSASVAELSACFLLVVFLLYFCTFCHSLLYFMFYVGYCFSNLIWLDIVEKTFFRPVFVLQRLLTGLL